MLDRFRLPAWDVDARANELRDCETGAVQRIEPKVMAVLVRLAEEAGQPVAREALMASVWPEVVVSEDALNRAVSKLRRALGDDPAQPRYVETIPTVGYRLVAPLERMDEVGDAVSPIPSRDSYGRWIAWGLAALAVIVLVFFAVERPEPDRAPALRPLTRAVGAEIYPALAPGGQRVAYAVRGRESDSYDLAAQALAAEVPLRLTDSSADDVQPVWDRTADALWFLRCPEPLVCSVWRVPATGGPATRLAEAPVGRWGLTATRDAVVAIARDSLAGPYRLVALDHDTGVRQDLTDPLAGTLGDLYPEASSDGRHIAFVRHDALGEEDLFVLDLEGETLRRLTTDGRGIRGHAWTADGRSLVYVANRDGAEALWRVGVDGGEPERVPIAVAGRLRSPTLAGGRLVLAVHQVEIGLHTWGGGGWKPVVPSTAVDTDPAIAADGRLAFVSTRSGAPELYVATDGAAPRKLTAFEGPLVGAPRWDPTGERLAFEAQVRGQASVYVVDAAGGPPRALTDDAGYDVGARWSLDGRALYFASNRRDPVAVDTLAAWALWRVAASGGEPERVGPLGSYVGEALPDGRLVYMREAEPGLWLRASRTGPEERLLTDLAREDWGNWSVIEADIDPAIVYPRRTDDGVEIRRLRLADRSDVLITTLEALPGRIQALGVSPDGQRLVAAQVGRAESDLVLLEPFK